MDEPLGRVTQPRAVRLLSLDGGGVRGLSSLLILQRMMEMINPNQPPKPCEYFDLIGGTSTGGLIAIMLGRLRMHASEAIDVYRELSRDVFQPRRNQIDFLARARDRVQLRGRFDGDALARAVRGIMQKSGENPEARLLEPQAAPCKVFVCSVLQEVSQPVLLRSYPSPGVASQLDCKIWEACRATSAATSFFDPISIGPFGQQFSDGATGWNNPVRQVYTEARRLWPDSKIKCLVSIGTGKPRLSAFGDGLRDVARTLVRMATETELTAEEFLLDHADLGLAKAYFRFNVPQGLEEVGLQEYSAVPTIASATMAYLESQEASEQVKQCVLQLRAEVLEEIIEDLCLTTDEEKWLHSLYTTDYAFHRSTVSTPVSGTCRWFLQHQKYVSWRNVGHSNLLWVSGDPGCGKSVLSSFLVDNLTANPPKGKTPDTTLFIPYTTLYFFCDDKIQEHRDAPAIVRGILHQLVVDQPGLVKRHFGSRFRPRGTAVANELVTLWDLFVAVCQDRECPPLIIIIDALDECEEQSRTRFLSLIATFYSNRSGSTKGNSVKMLITSRPEISIADSLEVLEEVRLKAEDETESISKDVVLVTRERLRATLRRFNPPAHIVQNLTERLSGQAGHTFLWVSLMLQMIERSAEASEDALDQILVDLPDGLDGVYEKILARAQGRNRQKAMAILQVVVAASRPLRLSELNFAISVRPGDTTADDLRTRLEPNLPRTLQMLCGPFLKVINSTVTLVHQTAKEFLLRAEGGAVNSTSWKHALDPAESHLTITRGCLLALSTNESVNDRGDASFATYALEYWIIHLLECEERLDPDLVEQVISLRTATRESPFSAKKTVLPDSLTKGSYFPDTSLGFASLCGFCRIIEQLLNGNRHAVNRADSSGMTAIDYSALSGRSGAMATLLRLGANPTSKTIGLATTGRSPDIVAALLRSGTISLLGGGEGRDQMILAVETGHEGLARLLVERGVRTDMKLNEGEDTPLIVAVKRGDARLAKVLLASGSLHVRDGMGRTAVHWAAENGYEAIVRMLIASRARVNDTCDYGETPLLKAVKGRYRGVVRCLLDQGADANTPDIRGSVPLWWAAIDGDEALVRALLPVTHVDDIQGPEGTLSWWARRNGHVRTAEILEAHRSQRSPLSSPFSPTASQPASAEEDIHLSMCVAARVNGCYARAVISTGAQATIVSESFARKSKIHRLIDKRFAGVARGVGTAQIIGRIHVSQIQLGSDAGFCVPMSLTVLEYQYGQGGPDILLGLDFLKRYQCTVDFRQNRLVFPFMKTTVPIFEDFVKRRRVEGGRDEILV